MRLGRIGGGCMVAAALVIVTPTPFSSAQSWRCAGSVEPTPTLRVEESVTENESASTIPGAIQLAAGNEITPLGGDTLIPDSADQSAFSFGWKHASENDGSAPYPDPKGWAAQFALSGAHSVEFLVYARPNAAWNLMVDGEQLWDTARTTPVAENARNLIKFTLPDAGRHTVRFYMNNLSLVDVFGPTGSTLKPFERAGPRVFFLGDSFTQGSRQSTGGELGSWIWRFANLCGWSDAWNGGMGSTGSIATGGHTNYVSRADSDVRPAEPDIVFISGYYNDRGSPASDIGAAFGKTIDIVKNLPNKPSVIVTGSYDPAGLNGEPYDHVEAAVLATCTQRGVPYISPRTGLVYDGTGRPIMPGGDAGPWVTVENRSTLVGADNVHPSDAGQRTVAYRMYNAMLALSTSA